MPSEYSKISLGFFSDEFDNPSDIISCVELFLMNILFSEYFKRFFLNVKGGEKASANYILQNMPA